VQLRVWAIGGNVWIRLWELRVRRVRGASSGPVGIQQQRGRRVAEPLGDRGALAELLQPTAAAIAPLHARLTS
jgi:hypothetical protein